MPPHATVRTFNEIYFASFQQHAQHVNTHFSTGDPIEPPLPPSFITPNTFWSSSEKSAFFHALSRFSRLRPDLIAESLGTKSFLEVSAYLDALGYGSKQLGTKKRSRDSLPAAREMSDSWVELECGMAKRFCFDEESAKRRTMLAARRSALKDGAGASGSADVSPRERTLEDINLTGDRHAALEARWKREDFLRDLDIDRLAALDFLIQRRESEDVSARADRQTPLVEQSPSMVDQDDIEHSGPSEEPSQPLSPREKARIRKRLHMRRKRAGDNAVANTSTAKLKAGRKRKREEDPIEQAGHAQLKAPRGLATVCASAEQVGLDPGMFRVDGTDLFHLNRIGDLMAIYADAVTTPDDASISVLPNEDPSRGEARARFPTVEYSTIHLLREYIRELLRHLIHQSISLAEEESWTKSRTKVWSRKKQQEVCAGHIETALKISGFRHVSRRIFIRQLPVRFNLPAHSSDYEPPSPPPPPTADDTSALMNHSFMREGNVGAWLLPREHDSSALVSDDDDLSDWDDRSSIAASNTMGPTAAHDLQVNPRSLRQAVQQDGKLSRQDHQHDLSYEATLRESFCFPPIPNIPSEEEEDIDSIRDTTPLSSADIPSPKSVIKSKATIDSSDEEFSEDQHDEES